MELSESKEPSEDICVNGLLASTSVRETALLDDDQSLSIPHNNVNVGLPHEDEAKDNNSEEKTISISNFSIDGCEINCNLTENEFMPESDSDIDEEIQFAFSNTVRETDLTDPFEIDNFNAKFIDIDTSFSEDEAKGTDSVLSSTDGGGSKGNYSEESDRRSSTQSNNTSGLLKATISELERALGDTKKLLTLRDEENTRLRICNTKLQQELDLEREKVNEMSQQLMFQRASPLDNEENRGIKEQESESSGGGDYALRETLRFLEDSLVQKEKELVKIRNEQNKGDDVKKPVRNEAPKTCKGKSVCRRSSSMSSASEVEELRNKVIDQEKELQDLRQKLNADLSASSNIYTQQVQAKDKASKLCDIDLHTQLRLKFLRDAFFYYMIDFHADEQIKAILAILEYEDKRQDIIFESHKMRQMGKRFTVTKVSSRCLTFVQEEIR